MRHREIAIVCSGLFERPAYIGDAGGPSAIMLVEAPRTLEVSRAAWPRAVMDFQGVISAPPRPSVERFLDRFGSDVERGTEFVRGTFPNGPNLQVSFDTEGRITGVEGLL